MLKWPWPSGHTHSCIAIWFHLGTPSGHLTPYRGIRFSESNRRNFPQRGFDAPARAGMRAQGFSPEPRAQVMRTCAFFSLSPPEKIAKFSPLSPLSLLSLLSPLLYSTLQYSTVLYSLFAPKPWIRLPPLKPWIPLPPRTQTVDSTPSSHSNRGFDSPPRTQTVDSIPSSHSNRGFDPLLALKPWIRLPPRTQTVDSAPNVGLYVLVFVCLSVYRAGESSEI
jgi:hypothetical protein